MALRSIMWGVSSDISKDELVILIDALMND